MTSYHRRRIRTIMRRIRMFMHTMPDTDLVNPPQYQSFEYRAESWVAFGYPRAFAQLCVEAVSLQYPHHRICNVCVKMETDDLCITLLLLRIV